MTITVYNLGEYKGNSKPTQKAIKQALDRCDAKLQLIECYAELTKDRFWIIILNGVRIGQMLRNKTSNYFDRVDTYSYSLHIGKGL